MDHAPSDVHVRSKKPCMVNNQQRCMVLWLDGMHAFQLAATHGIGFQTMHAVQLTSLWNRAYSYWVSGNPNISTFILCKWCHRAITCHCAHTDMSTLNYGMPCFLYSSKQHSMYCFDFYSEITYFAIVDDYQPFKLTLRVHWLNMMQGCQLVFMHVIYFKIMHGI